MFENADIGYPAESCEYCGECQNYEEWSFDCEDFYEKEDEPGCPTFGWELNDDMPASDITANEACCWYVRLSIDVC